jgi:hypothetical protein
MIVGLKHKTNPWVYHVWNETYVTSARSAGWYVLDALSNKAATRSRHPNGNAYYQIVTWRPYWVSNNGSLRYDSATHKTYWLNDNADDIFSLLGYY